MSTLGNTKFCTACGNSLIESAVICPKCGSPTNNFNQTSQTSGQQNSYSGPHNPEARSKTAAVLLAVFVGIWSFLYTFKADAKFFWLGLSTPPAAVLVVALLSGGRLMGWHILFALFVSTLVSILAIVRQAVRPSEWFARYPNVT
jgi:uncharacterized OB-fold protein